MFGTLSHIPLIIIQMTVALHCTVHPMSSRVCQALINSIILHTYWILVGRPIAPQSTSGICYLFGPPSRVRAI